MPDLQKALEHCPWCSPFCNPAESCSLAYRGVAAMTGNGATPVPFWRGLGHICSEVGCPPILRESALPRAHMRVECRATSLPLPPAEGGTCMSSSPSSCCCCLPSLKLGTWPSFPLCFKNNEESGTCHTPAISARALPIREHHRSQRAQILSSLRDRCSVCVTETASGHESCCWT